MTDAIESREQLEVLLLVRAHQAREWDARAVAASLHLPVERATDALERLCSRGFLAVRTAHELLFRYDPNSDATDRFAAGLARAHAEQLGAPTSDSPDPLSVFAAAFDLRKK